MFAKIVRMPLPVVLSDQDLAISKAACRRIAARCRRQGAIDEAAHWQRVADKIARARTPRCSSEG
jgi:hypothetical protein